ncbi:MAG: hypothetical protein E6J50_00690 [Chloroflexi bacterium]|nr:MAG: hypothetical protein E6J50_00690 [Chloroflexota bacterium]
MAASSMVTSQYRPSLRRPVGASLVLLVAALVLTVTPVLARNVLSSAVVAPRTGTTATVFLFSVHYAGKPATSVVARVGTLTVALSLVSGTTSSGTWRGSRRLPAGTRSVTFSATAVGKVADLPAGHVTTTAPPTPTPVPTPKPPAATPRPSARPTRSPASSPARSPRVSPSARAIPTGGPPSTPTAVGGATQPSSSPGTAAGGTADQSGPLLPAIVLGLFVILGVGGIALLTGRRQAEERPSAESGGLPDAPLAPEFVRRAVAAGATGAAASGSRPRAAWEVSTSLENEPLGSLDEGPSDGGREPRSGDSPFPPEESGSPAESPMSTPDEARPVAGDLPRGGSDEAAAASGDELREGNEPPAQG